MKKVIAVLVLATLSGCASQSTTSGLTRQMIALGDAQQQFQQSTIEAQRNTVARVHQLELRVDDLANRVCELERSRGHNTADLDRKFKKYMSK